jgi:hypothetical protein
MQPDDRTTGTATVTADPSIVVAALTVTVSRSASQFHAFG